MPVPVHGHQPMEMKNYEQLAAIFHEVGHGFLFSHARQGNDHIFPISEQHQPVEKAGGDLVNHTKNYSKDPRHLVLLKGYR